MTRFELAAEVFADLVRCMEIGVEALGRDLADWFDEHGPALERHMALVQRLRAINAARPGWQRYLMAEALVRHPAWRGRAR